MKIKIVLMMGIFGVGLMALLFSGDSGDQDSNRIGKLEAQIGDLQKQVKELQSQVKALEAKPIYRLAPPAPDTRVPGTQTPPGAKRYNFNGQDFWLVPLSPDPKS